MLQPRPSMGGASTAIERHAREPGTCGTDLSSRGDLSVRGGLSSRGGLIGLSDLIGLRAVPDRGGIRGATSNCVRECSNMRRSGLEMPSFPRRPQWPAAGFGCRHSEAVIANLREFKPSFRNRSHADRPRVQFAVCAVGVGFIKVTIRQRGRHPDRHRCPWVGKTQGLVYRLIAGVPDRSAEDSCHRLPHHCFRPTVERPAIDRHWCGGYQR